MKEDPLILSVTPDKKMYLDKDYFEAGKKRLEQHQAAPRLFDMKVETYQQMKIA